MNTRSSITHSDRKVSCHGFDREFPGNVVNGLQIFSVPSIMDSRLALRQLYMLHIPWSCSPRNLGELDACVYPTAQPNRSTITKYCAAADLTTTHNRRWTEKGTLQMHVCNRLWFLQVKISSPSESPWSPKFHLDTEIGSLLCETSTNLFL